MKRGRNGRPLLSDWEICWFLQILETTGESYLDLDVFARWLTGQTLREIAFIKRVSPERIRQRVNRCWRRFHMVQNNMIFNDIANTRNAGKIVY